MLSIQVVLASLGSLVVVDPKDRGETLVGFLMALKVVPEIRALLEFLVSLDHREVHVS